MKKRAHRYIFIIAAAMITNSCKHLNDHIVHDGAGPKAITPSLTQESGRENIITAAEQKALTPDSVIQNLKEGNRRYMTGNLTKNDYVGMMRTASQAQYPEAFILSCIDSRVPVEEIFDKSIGDLFVGRVAGNIVDEDILGSMEYACKVSGSKLIVVLGHESCGAVKAAIENEQLGNITAMLMKIKPALIQSKDFAGEQTADNAAFVEHAVKKNILNTIQMIRQKSTVLKQMMDKAEIRVVGAYYGFETGEVVYSFDPRF